MKYSGIFTTAATKALKKASAVYCQYDEEARQVYLLAGGYLAMVMTPADYDAVARPATGRDPGDWIWRDGQVQPLTTDIKAVVEKNVAPVLAADGTLATVMPVRYSSGKCTVMACYASGRDTVAMADESLLAAFDSGLTLPHVAASNQGIVMVSHGDNMVGLVMPVKLDAKIARSVRAYYWEDAAAGSVDVDSLRSEIASRNALIADKNREIDSLKAELEKLQAAAGDAVKADAVKTDESAADRAGEVAGRLCELDGLQVVVNGAATATPVVWISGDVNAHADAIRAEGGKYSVKKGAYYIKIV